MTSSKFLRLSLPFLIVAVGVVGFIALRATSPKVISKTNLEKVWPVSVIKLKVIDFRPEIIEFGTVVAGNQADLRPLVSGRIIEVGPNYYEGAVIKKGEALVTIDPFDYAMEVADRNAGLSEVLTKISEAKAEKSSEIKMLSISKSQLSLREKDLNRRRSLVKKGSASRKSLDDSLIAFNEAAKSVASRQQTLSRLDNRLDQYRASAERARSVLKLAERNLQETLLVAPFDGFLANAEASVGQRVGNTDRLARLIEVGRLEVRFRLAERDFAALLPKDNMVRPLSEGSSELIGKRIGVKWQVGDRKLLFNAVIERLGAEIDASTGGVDVYARLLDVDFMTPLRPGAFVEVSIRSQLYKDVVRIPSTAVLNGSNIYFIQDGRLVSSSVNIIRRGGEWVLIRGRNLQNKILVIRPFPEMASGIKVEAR